MKPFSLKKLRIPISDFWKLPKQTRSSLVLLGLFLNEINWLMRLLVKADQGLRESSAQKRLTPEQEAAEALVALIATTLVGKVYESWDSISKRKRKSRNLLDRVCERKRELPSLFDVLILNGLILSEETKDLKAIFEEKLSTRLFRRIRNQLGFHYDAKMIHVDRLKKILTDSDAHFFIHPEGSIGFTLSRLSTIALIEAIIGRASVRDRPKAFLDKISEIIDTSGAFSAFVNHLLIDILRPSANDLYHSNTSLPDAPFIDDESQPLRFFIHPPKDFAQDN